MSNAPSQPDSNDRPVEGLLRGQKVLVTRPAAPQVDPTGPANPNPDGLFMELQRNGAEVIHHPVIEIKPLDDFAELDARLNSLDQFDRLVFVSRNGVEMLIHRLGQLEILINTDKIRIAAVGKATENALEKYGVIPDLIPAIANSRSMAAKLIASARSDKILIVRASRGSDELAQALHQANIAFEEVVAYQNTDVERVDPDVLSLMEQGEIDWVTCTSSAIASSTVQLFGDALRKSKIVSISPITSEVIKELGYQVSAQAKSASMKAVVAAMIAAE